MSPRKVEAPAKGLKFYPKSHRYRLDGQWVPGVTTILNVLHKPALTKWAAGEVAAFVANNQEHVEHLYHAGPTVMTAALKEVPFEKKDKAAKKGTSLHDIGAQLVTGDDVDVPDHLVGSAEALVAFLDDWQIDPVLVEKPVGHRAHQYAGTLDLGAHYVHPVTGHRGFGIFDYKSGRRIYAEAAWQISGYGFAEFWVDCEIPTDPAEQAPVTGPEEPMPEFDAAFGVHIQDGDYAVHPVHYGPEVFEEFVGIRATWAAHKRGTGDWQTPGSGYVGLPVNQAAW